MSVGHNFSIHINSVHTFTSYDSYLYFSKVTITVRKTVLAQRWGNLCWTDLNRLFKMMYWWTQITACNEMLVWSTYSSQIKQEAKLSLSCRTHILHYCTVTICYLCPHSVWSELKRRASEVMFVKSTSRDLRQLASQSPRPAHSLNAANSDVNTT